MKDILYPIDHRMFSTGVLVPHDVGMAAIRINLSPSVHAAVAAASQASGRTMTEWIAWAVERGLALGGAQRMVQPVRPARPSVGWSEEIAVRAPGAMVKVWDRAARRHPSRSAWAGSRIERWSRRGQPIMIRGDLQGSHGQRERLVKFRLTAHEAQILRDSAAAADVTISALLRTLLC